MERERAGTGGGELDGEGKSVETGADVGNDRTVLVGEFERGAGRIGPRDEEGDGVIGPERWHWPNGLATHPQSLAARGEDPQRRAVTQQIFGDFSRGRDHVLAVVEDDEHLAIVDHLGQPVRVRQRERGRDRGPDARRVADWREFHQAPAELENCGRIPRHFQREPGLAHSSRAYERDQTRLGQQPRELGALHVAADQGGQWFRDGDARIGTRSRSRAGDRRCIQ